MGCASSKPSTADSETAKPPAAPQRANPAARPAVSSLEEQTQPVPKPGPAAVLPPSRPGENGVQSAHSSGSQPQQTPTKQQQQTLQPSLIQPEIQAAQNGPTTPSTASAQHEQVPKIAMAGPLAAGPLGDIAGSEQLPMRPITPDAAPAADRPVATFHQLSPPMLNIGALPSGNLPAVRSEGALYTGVLASQPIRPQEGSSAVGESGELMLPYPAPYVPSPSLPAPDDPNLPLDDHWRPQRRKAVLIACNYVQSPAISQLRGCINDMHCMREMLMVNFRFQPQDMLVLDDEQTDPEYVPTKGNVLAAADWLVGDCQAYDSLIFFFSGYGGQLIEGGDHEHPCGDTLLPVDHAEVGHITAEELEGVLLQRLPAGARLHTIIDASPAPCPLRLPCSVTIQPNGWGTWQGVQAARALPRRMSRTPGTESVDAAFQVSPLNRVDRHHTASTDGGEALLFSSSWSEEGPPDLQTMSNVKSTGAMAYCLIQAVQLGHSQTYNTLIRAMRYALKNGPQHFGEMPRLTSTVEFNLNRSFIL